MAFKSRHLTPLSHLAISVLLVLMLSTMVGALTASQADEVDLTSGRGASSGSYPWASFKGDLNNSGNSVGSAPGTDNLLWVFDTGDEVYSSPSVANGNLFIGSRNGKVYCLNQSTGEPVWEFATGTGYMYGVVSAPSIVNGMVFFGSNNDVVYALPEVDPNGDGLIAEQEVLWSYATDDEIYSSPAVADGLVLIGSNDGHLYALDMMDGSLVWKYDAGEAIYSSPAVADGLVFFGTGPCEGSGQARLFSLDIGSGELVWSYPLEDSVTASPIVWQERLYIGGVDGHLYAFDADPSNDEDEGLDDNGAKYDLLWAYDIGDFIYGSASVDNGSVYIGALDGRVHCLDAVTGTHIWNFTTGNDIYGSPALADGKLYIGSIDGKLYCLNATDGELIWDHVTGYAEYGISSSPAIAYGNVFVGACDGMVYAFGDPALQPLDIELSAEVTSLAGGSRTMIFLSVSNGTTPIQGASVEFSVDRGEFSVSSGLTDANGNLSTLFIAPTVYYGRMFEIEVLAQYESARGRGSLSILVEPAGQLLSLSISAREPLLNQDERTRLIVQVLDGIEPVEGARVTLTSEDGKLLNANGTTNSQGQLTVTYQAPRVSSSQSYTVHALVEKSGYVTASAQCEVMVEAKPDEEDLWRDLMVTLIISMAIMIATTLFVRFRGVR